MDNFGVTTWVAPTENYYFIVDDTNLVDETGDEILLVY